MTRETILVCGFGRCGSSLVMQMLDAAGVPCAGRYPAYEPAQVGPMTFDREWLAGQGGRAVKMLDPQLLQFSIPDQPYRTIWLDRDHKQQCKSAEKFMAALHGMATPWTRTMRRAWITGYRRDRPRAVRKLRGLGPVLELTFETLIGDPLATAKRICDFIKPWPVIGEDSPRAMEFTVVKRGPECLPYLLEAELMRGLSHD